MGRGREGEREGGREGGKGECEGVDKGEMNYYTNMRLSVVITFYKSLVFLQGKILSSLSKLPSLPISTLSN